MRLEKIESEELKRQIALRVGKFSFNDVTEEDLDLITEITLSLKSGKETERDYDLSVVTLFPALKKIRIIGFDIKQEDIDIISSLEDIEAIEFSRCKIDEVDFGLLEDRLKRIDFSECGELNFKYPNVKNILVNMCILDFDKVDLDSVENIYVMDSIIRNVPSLNECKVLRKVNFDGSKIIDKDGNEVKEISILEHIEYSHKDKAQKIDKNNLRDKKDIKTEVSDNEIKDDEEDSLIL